jgi:predicted dehydrogenase
MREHENPRSGPSEDNVLTRRRFVENVGAAVASSSLLGGAVSAASDQPVPVAKPIQRKLKLGIIGCGGRGSWIAGLFKQHGGYEIHALSDYFQDVVDKCGDAVGVDEKRRFSGLSGYKKVIDSGVEAVVVINLPCFHPQHAEAAAAAGCHVYMAKPIAVDVPGCLRIEALGRRATEQKRCFLVDYQLPTEPANIEVARRIREGALGRLAYIVSFSVTSVWPDPPKGPTIENRLRGGIWPSDVALGGDGIVAYDIHIIDGVTWVMGKRPVGACGRSRTCRPEPHGDRTDCSGVVYEYEDGVLWTHATQSLANNADTADLSASFFGLSAMGHIQYGGNAYVRGGPKHYVGTIGSIYDQGANRNIAEFYRNITEGRFENPTVKRAVDGTLTAILGREASARRRYLTTEEVIKENRQLSPDLTGLKV